MVNLSRRGIRWLALTLALPCFGGCASNPPDVIYLALFQTSPNFPTETEPTEHPAFPAHSAYMEMLRDEGWVVRGGPFADLSGAVLEFRSDDPDQIDRLLRQEPFVLENLWTYKIRAWVQALK